MFSRELPVEGGQIYLDPAGITHVVAMNVAEQKMTLVPSINLLRPTVRAKQVIESTRRRSRRIYSADIISSSMSYGGMTSRRQIVHVVRRAVGGGRRYAPAPGPSVRAPIQGAAHTRVHRQPQDRQQTPSTCCVIL